ncbi:hypothetical protein K437DRAFT_254683 [Tilletiaria anomala UBC 951]|uniref:Uncharacterized protein n=1 Tax=Tilletiaria anomala (strain ATCC 24038 / CBS 436.72 / UBC 951) TaxID=1037660 RepID=A0A066WEB7_TILAU|nr:uncharacterized protein K437DRAFT_254683 [Tilletiaria anomala UBC 951]KDN52121.1 hypothetical protein K437DRAFT_254683 [Tilletiaria anomala UBC 951]
MMLGLRQSFSRLSCACSTLRTDSGPLFRSTWRPTAAPSPINLAYSALRLNVLGSVRFRSQLAPRRTKYRKAHKGRVPVPIGGSIVGTTIQEGAFGIRLLAPARLSAKQLQSAETALKRKLKVVKGAQVFMRVFPDIPVCVKGNETRMGKGKGSFEFWACRASVGKVIFEVGGPVEIRQEVAKEALRLAAAKLPVPTEFITKGAAPRLGNIVGMALDPKASTLSSKASSTSLTLATNVPSVSPPAVA